MSDNGEWAIEKSGHYSTIGTGVQSKYKGSIFNATIISSRRCDGMPFCFVMHFAIFSSLLAASVSRELCLQHSCYHAGCDCVTSNHVLARRTWFEFFFFFVGCACAWGGGRLLMPHCSRGHTCWVIWQSICTVPFCKALRNTSYCQANFSHKAISNYRFSSRNKSMLMWGTLLIISFWSPC